MELTVFVDVLRENDFLCKQQGTNDTRENVYTERTKTKFINVKKAINTLSSRVSTDTFIMSSLLLLLLLCSVAVRARVAGFRGSPSLLLLYSPVLFVVPYLLAKLPWLCAAVLVLGMAECCGGRGIEGGRGADGDRGTDIVC